MGASGTPAPTYAGPLDVPTHDGHDPAVVHWEHCALRTGLLRLVDSRNAVQVATRVRIPRRAGDVRAVVVTEYAATKVVRTWVSI